MSEAVDISTRLRVRESIHAAEPLRVGMILHDPQSIGGLEEIAVTLAIALQARGVQVSVLSDTWVPPHNQYFERLRSHRIPVSQVPKWLSRPASHWSTKERLVRYVMWLLSPLVVVIGTGLCLGRKLRWRSSVQSTFNWLRQHLAWPLLGPDRRAPLTRLLLSWWRWRWRPDVIHIQGYTSGLLFAVDWVYEHGVPMVYQEHQTPVPEFDWWDQFPAVINKADVVVAASQESVRGLRAICGVIKPIEVMGHPPVADPVQCGWRRDEPRHEPGARLRISTVARLSVAKGLTYLLESAAVVTKRYPSVEFRVYGEGPLKEDLMEHARQLGLDGCAIFVGPFTSREELGMIMAQTDIFVMPSILEGQPVGLVEALAYGQSVVATRVGGIPELIDHGANGLLCPPADSNALTQNICALVEDPALRARLAEAARASYERSQFQPASVCDSFIALYRHVLCGRSSESAAGS